MWLFQQHTRGFVPAGRTLLARWAWRWWCVCLACCLALVGGGAWADDADDGGGGAAAADGGGGGGAAAAGDAGADGGTGPGEAYTPLLFRPHWPVERFVADGLVAVNPPPDALQMAVARLGAQEVTTHVLPGLGLRLVHLRLLGVDAATALEELSLAYPGVFALQHLYKTAQHSAAGGSPEGCAGVLCELKNQLGWPINSAGCGRQQRVGLVDTWVDTQSPGLAHASVQTRVFLSGEQQPAQDGHGTAVASLLVGAEPGGYQGMLPKAGLWVGVPFYTLPSGQSAADVVGLVRAMDWLLQNGVQVMGLALAGPANPVLSLAVEKAQQRGVLLVAAAGNGGRLAPPAHPAALDGVLAVTAVNRDNQVYRRANQGRYIAYAMPGVEVPTLAPDGKLQASSGTSYAVPFLLAAVSQSLYERRLSPAQWRAGSDVPVRDLGPMGRDPVFGWGLPGLGWRCP